MARQMTADKPSTETDATPSQTDAVLVTDGGEDTIEWTTERGSKVTVTAETGSLYVTLEDGTDETGASSSFSRQRATLERERSTDVLDCGVQRDDDGEQFRALIPIEVPKSDLKELRKESEVEPTDDPVKYRVVERSQGGRSWGQKITSTRLKRNKSYNRMTEKQKELDRKVSNKNDVPSDADVGDVIPLEDLVDDMRTRDEKDQDALDEAAETGEEVVVKKMMSDCNDPSKECNLDHVRRVATPEEEIETRRTHTY